MISALRTFYRGENAWDILGVSRKVVLGSLLAVLICVVALLVRGLNLGIEFEGGSVWEIPVPASAQDAADHAGDAATGSATDAPTTDDIAAAAAAAGVPDARVQLVTVTGSEDIFRVRGGARARCQRGRRERCAGHRRRCRRREPVDAPGQPVVRRRGGGQGAASARGVLRADRAVSVVPLRVEDVGRSAHRRRARHRADRRRLCAVRVRGDAGDRGGLPHDHGLFAVRHHRRLRPGQDQRGGRCRRAAISPMRPLQTCRSTRC